MNLMELFVKIGVDDQASSKVSTLTDKIGGGLKTAASVGVKAITMASTAIVSLTGLAIKNYAEYEQLVGGVETLFKDSAGKVQEYAANAYKTAGMSANDYMDTVTSFSASLLQSLGNDTAAASDYADRAITDMSDNANKMGTSIEMIQDAYQGFAKQNYTMLDNLKLGYGGTKTEMERLIADANRVKEANGEMGDLSIESFADVTEAIHIMQTEMGITGTTAKEAATTISGSIGMMKAAWSNLVTGIADDNVDFDGLINNFVESAGIAADNLIPRIEIALTGVGKLIEEIFPIIMDEIPTIIANTLPSILESAVSIVTAIGQGLLDNAELILNTAVDLILMLAEGLAQGLPHMVPAIVEVVLKIVDILTQPKTLNSLIDAAIEIIIALAEGLINAIPKLLEYVPKIIVNIAETLISNLPKILTVGIEILKALWDGINNWSQTLLKKVKDLAKKLPEKIKSGIGSLATKGKNWIKSIWTGVKSWSEDLKEKVLELAKSLPKKIKNGIGSLFTIGQNWIQGMWNGIKDKKDWLIQKITGLAKNAKQAIKDFFGIKSPSRVMRDEVGKPIAEGIGVGFMENDPIGQIKDNLNQGLKTIIPTVKMSGAQIDFGGNAGGGVSVVQNIYSTAKTAADLMQEAIYQQEKAVYLGV